MIRRSLLLSAFALLFSIIVSASRSLAYAEACARYALGPYWQNVTAQQQQQYANRYEDYIVIVYSTLLAHFGGEASQC